MGDFIFAHMQVSAADLLPGAALAGFSLKIKVSNSYYSIPGVALAGFYLSDYRTTFSVFDTRRSTCGNLS